ncbi:MAG: mannitol dehydrogenase family protein [Spirochaetaceae bacterium]|nr:mannitol dehydrogenase family protein [Spirochaetaceae bacterium]
MELNKKNVREHAEVLQRAGIELPCFDIDAVRAKTLAAPVWVHIGPGNLFRAFHAALQQSLLDKGLSDRGIIAVSPVDFTSFKKLAAAHDNLFARVVMKADGGLDIRIIASMIDVIAANPADAGEWTRLTAVFRNPSLQMVTLAVTEKGYDLRTLDGKLRPSLLEELDQGLAAPSHLMLRLCVLLHERYQHGAVPVAMVSTDNFSHNGAKLKDALVTLAHELAARGAVENGFIDYLTDKRRVSFPFTMIDKITPLPSERTAAALAERGLAGMEITHASSGTANAPFVNTEEAEYLVVEDDFPNGRPPLEQAGVYFTDAETVDKVERMKVCTCLNPLHTALAIYGCLLGYTSIADEMKDGDLNSFVTMIAHREGIAVVTDPGIIKPDDFVREVLTARFPNPNNPDTPQRIATDTSQKLAIRFGETIKLYVEKPDLDVDKLVLIPLVLAGWCRYLLGQDDNGAAFTLSPDPLLNELQPLLTGIELGKPESAAGKLCKILSNEKIFGLDLYRAGLGNKIEGYFAELIAGSGAVRKTLRRYLS